MNVTLIEKLYGSVGGRILVKLGLRIGLSKLFAACLRSPASKRRIPRFIRRYGVSTEDFAEEDYPTFAAFFERRKSALRADPEPSHLISPFDGLLSVYSLRTDSSF